MLLLWRNKQKRRNLIFYLAFCDFCEGFVERAGAEALQIESYVFEAEGVEFLNDF